MPKKFASHHVVPNRKGGWDVRKGGSYRASRHYDTKREAVDSGRDISRNQGSELFIHGFDGRIQEKGYD
ncbi:MAG: DUF2188 domain-containing protein [Gammaproteobacteria bacterium]|nr:DUF2188 domain-containing protein [Gammaproteobacteria bacterium]